MVGGNISSEKIDLLVYGPNKPIIDKGFPISSCSTLRRRAPISTA